MQYLITVFEKSRIINQFRMELISITPAEARKELVSRHGVNPCDIWIQEIKSCDEGE